MSNDLDRFDSQVRITRARLDRGDAAGAQQSALIALENLSNHLRSSPPAQPQPACPSRSAFGDACELPLGHELHRAGKVAWTTVEDDEPPEPPRQVMTGAPGDEELERIANVAVARAMDSGEPRGATKFAIGSRAIYEAGLAHARAENEGLRKDHAECPGRIDRAWHAGFSAATGEGEGS